MTKEEKANIQLLAKFLTVYTEKKSYAMLTRYFSLFPGQVDFLCDWVSDQQRYSGKYPEVFRRTYDQLLRTHLEKMDEEQWAIDVARYLVVNEKTIMSSETKRALDSLKAVKCKLKLVK